jgi:L-fuconolactonase
MASEGARKIGGIVELVTSRTAFFAGGADLVRPLDAHQHFWDPRSVPLPWLTAELAAIDRPFLPADLAPELAGTGVEGTVLVQSACSDADTDFMLAVADEHEWIRAVVAWVDLEQPARAEARLDEFAVHGRVRGIRHLIHDEADPRWILRSAVVDGLGLVEERGLVLELPAVWPRHLPDVPELAARCPTLRLVIDHLAKPPLAGPLDAWAEALRAAAECENVSAKFSGVDARALEPALEIALDAFGPQRLIWGSDWPVSLLTTTYKEFFAASVGAVERLAPEHADALLRGNAARLYALETVADFAGGGARGAH